MFLAQDALTKKVLTQSKPVFDMSYLAYRLPNRIFIVEEDLLCMNLLIALLWWNHAEYDMSSILQIEQKLRIKGRIHDGKPVDYDVYLNGRARYAIKGGPDHYIKYMHRVGPNVWKR